jgi:CRP-like cAMP-binding protein
MIDAERLRGIALFEGLGDDELGRCAELFSETELLAGTHLSREGEFAYKFYVVLEGDIEVQRNFEHIARLGPGDFFGEMGLLRGERRNARVLAHSRCDLASMMAWDFTTMTQDFPLVAERIEAVVAERLATIPDDE